MPSAELIAIGTELLLGEIQDTNTRFMARALRDAGIDIYRTTIVGDNAERIAQVLREAMERSNIIITTGGLGPTVDDPTRLAVALAVGVNTVFREDLWEQIQDRFKRFGRIATENNRRQAYIPIGAIPIENPVGTAPCFIIEDSDYSIISLPGVPREMEYLLEHTVLPYLKQHFNLQGTIQAMVIHAAGVGESQVDEWIGDLETYHNPTVGLLAHPGQIDVRVTAKANSVDEANRLILEVANIVRQRLGDSVYGFDEDTLEQVAIQKLAANHWSMLCVECGLGGEAFARLNKQGFPADHVVVLPQNCDMNEIKEQVREQLILLPAHVALGASLLSGVEKQTLILYLITPDGVQETTRSYGGPPAHGIQWGTNTTLDYLRRNIQLAID